MGTLLELCAKKIAESAYAQFPQERWAEPADVEHPDKLWQRMQNELSCSGTSMGSLPPHLRKAISRQILTVKFAELGIARIRMVRGGDIWQRYREFLKMAGPSRMTSNQGNGLEDARLYLDKQRTLETGITWSTIHNLTALGNVVQHPCVDVISLSYDESYVSYQFDENHLTITLHSASVDEYDDCAFILEQAKQSLQWVFENFARPSCKFLSPSAKLEPTMLSNLPAVITELTLCNMSMFLAIREGLERCRWWVENFSQDLQHVRRLILVNCEYDSMDLHRLRERLKDAQIDVDGEDKPHL